MGPFAKVGSRMKITSRDTSAEDERQQYGYYDEGPVAPIDIERVEAPVTFKVARASDSREAGSS